MDVLLSLPIFSYFLAPGITSWSTSLNVLFFYMTWSTLVLSHPPWRIHVLALLAVRTLLWFIPSLLSLAFDTLFPSLAGPLKHNNALPPRNTRIIARQAGLALFNMALITGLEFSLIYLLGPLLPIDSATIFHASTTLPLPWQLGKQILLMMMLREFLTFHIHRSLLSDTATLLGKWHVNSPAHARRAPPYSLLLYADHPASVFLHRFVPTFAAALIARPHMLTYVLFIAMTTAEETFAMSGYNVVPGIILGGMARRTAAHYASGGKGNFGAWGLLDWVHDTTVGKDLIEDVKDEGEKHAVKERAGAAAGTSMGAVKDAAAGLRRSTRRKTQNVE